MQPLKARSLCLLPLVILLQFAACGGGSSGPGGSDAGGVRIDPTLAALVPSDTVNLAGGRIDRLQKSPLYGKLKPLLPAGAGGESGLRERFGLDPSTDLREFLFAHNGKSGLLLASGKFPAKDILERLTKEGAEKSLYKGKTILGRESAGGLAILGDGLLAAGPASQLHALIDGLASGSGPKGLPAPLAKGLATLPADSHLYFAGAGGATFNLPQGTNLGNLDKVLASLESIAGFVDLSKGFKLSASGQSTDEAAAKRLHTQLRGLIGMGRLSTPDNQPGLLKLFDAIETKLTGRSIAVGIDLTLEQAERALEVLRGAAAR